MSLRGGFLQTSNCWNTPRSFLLNTSSSAQLNSNSESQSPCFTLLLILNGYPFLVSFNTFTRFCAHIFDYFYLGFVCPWFSNVRLERESCISRNQRLLRSRWKPGTVESGILVLFLLPGLVYVNGLLKNFFKNQSALLGYWLIRVCWILDSISLEKIVAIDELGEIGL